MHPSQPDQYPHLLHLVKTPSPSEERTGGKVKKPGARWEYPHRHNREIENMHWLYLLALTLVLSIAAGFLWKVDQVYSIAALATGFISLVWGFTWAPGWIQLLMVGLLFGLYRFYIQWSKSHFQRTLIVVRRKLLKSRVSLC